MSTGAPFMFTVLLLAAGFHQSGGYVWLEQISRQEELSQKCQQWGLTKQSLERRELDHILVDKGHRLLYCYVPKVACTNWKRILMVLTGKWGPTAHLMDIPGSLAHAENSTLRLSQLKSKKISKYLRNFTSFILVRHPFERLLSAFRNKFENPNSRYFHNRYGRAIIKKYRPNVTSADLETSTVTFREFVQYILDDGLAANEHWAPIYLLCRPCAVNYNFIGHYESLLEDSRALLDLIGAPQLNFPFTRSSNTSSVLRIYFQQLSLREIEMLYLRYMLDFKLFGYGLEDLLGFELG